MSSGDHTTDSGVAHNVALAEDALDAWAKKSPRDPQLARSYFLAAVVERKIWIRTDQERAWLYFNRPAASICGHLLWKTGQERSPDRLYQTLLRTTGAMQHAGSSRGHGPCRICHSSLCGISAANVGRAVDAGAGTESKTRRSRPRSRDPAASLHPSRHVDTR